MRCLGIDFGTVRIGLSYGDELGVAVPIAAATAADVAGRLSQIGDEIRRRRIERLVVGYPLNMDGSAGFKAREVDGFIARLTKEFGLPIDRIDERLSSYAADASAAPRSKRGARNKQALLRERRSGERDSRAAAVILQDYLDQRSSPVEADFPQ